MSWPTSGRPSMKNRTTLLLTGFVVAMAAVFGGSYLIGQRVPTAAAATEPGNVGSGTAQTEMKDEMDAAHDTADPTAADQQTGHAEGGVAHDAAHEETAGSASLPGLALSQDGYLLAWVSPTILQQGRSELRFRIADPAGRPVTDYTRMHEKDLHLIVVPRDLGGFRHVHPELAADGTWSVDVNLDLAGSWRVYADFTPTALGHGIVLGTDLTVAGTLTLHALPAPTDVSNVDGYAVTLTGEPMANTEAALTFRVTKGGRDVGDLDPYLGADGHLVALRVGDLAYLHTHPQSQQPTGGPEIHFASTFPSAGAYRVFLDFSHQGVVHTAAFTVTVRPSR